MLYRDKEIASVYGAFEEPALLYRAGGYWWDGAAWYRPAQVWDAAGEEYYQRHPGRAAGLAGSPPQVGNGHSA